MPATAAFRKVARVVISVLGKIVASAIVGDVNKL